MGDFDMAVFHYQQNQELLIGLFLVLVSLVSIVLLNLLIALMGSTYERATEKSTAASRYERACILLEIESIMRPSERSVSLPCQPPSSLDLLLPQRVHSVSSAIDTSCCCRPQDPRFFPRYLHVLREKPQLAAVNHKGAPPPGSTAQPRGVQWEHA
jgi:hypothetical protein